MYVCVCVFPIYKAKNSKYKTKLVVDKLYIYCKKYTMRTWMIHQANFSQNV